MELEFLQIGRYTQKGDYLQHITELFHIELKVGESYNNLFAKLREHFKDNAEKLKAVNVWIEYNQSIQEDQSIFEQVLIHETTEYAAFNLYKHN